MNINGQGNVYERSTEPKPGFVEHYNENTKQLAGYWREHPYGVVGYLNNISLKTRKNQQGIDVEYFVVTLRDYEGAWDYCFMFPLKTQSGGISRYVKSFVKYYKNIDFSRQICFNSMKRKPEDQYAPSELALSYCEAGMKDILIERYYKKGLNGWPEREKRIQYGKEVSDCTRQDMFCYDRLVEYIKDFGERIPEVRKHLEAKYGRGEVDHYFSQPDSYGEPEGYTDNSPQPPYATSPEPQPGQYESQVAQYQAANPQPQPRPQNVQSARSVQKPDYDDDLPF